MKVQQALILAGGLGKRLGDISLNCPKPMQKINGEPFLDSIIWNLKRHNINRIILSVGYLSEKIKEYYEDGESLNINIRYVEENVPLGTGGAVKNCSDLLEDNFFIINGDTLFDINLHDLSSTFIEGKIGHLALNYVENVSRYGEVKLKNSTIISFEEKENNRPGFINAGIGVFNKRILQYITSVPSSLEKDIYPKLLNKKLLTAKTYNSFFIDIGLPLTLKSSQKLIPKWRSKAALFLDRDGVINLDKKYVHSLENFKFIDNAKETIKLANDLGILVIVVTNQSGIARGYYTEEEFKTFSIQINDLLIAYGAHIDETYYCPHHPLFGINNFKKNCDCRKPNPGMIKKAILEWQLISEKCFLIGDKKSDILAADKCGITSYLFNHKKDNLLKVFKNKLPDLIEGI